MSATPRPKSLPDLGYFSGTEQWWKYPLMPKFSYTDGVRHVAMEASAYWLLDVVFSHVAAIYGNKEIPDEQKSMLVCKLVVDDTDKKNSAQFTITDGNYNPLAEQFIPFTDFPALEQEIWVENGVALLPSEH